MSAAFDPAVIDGIVAGRGSGRESLLGVLLDTQAEFGYLPEEGIRRIAAQTGTRPADVLGVASFYSRFRFSPAGRYDIRVCVGTACFVKGSDLVYDAFIRELRIPEGADTDGDGLFTVRKVACLGCCMLAPAVQIGEHVYGKVTRKTVPSVLADFLSTQRGSGEPDAEDFTATVPAGEIRMCTCTSCRAAGADRVIGEIRKHVRDNHLPVTVKESGCTGMSYRAPVVEIVSGGTVTARYGNVNPGQAAELVSRHFRYPSFAASVRTAADRLMERLIVPGDRVERGAIDIRAGTDADFLGPQVRIVTEGFETLDPLDIEEYRRSGGFAALEKIRNGLEGVAIISLLEESGLRGRGGAGYPAGRKWRAVSEAQGTEKYVICNADEGDPGAFMDRTIVESFPFRVIEGIIVAGLAVGARKGYVYVRAEYPLALRRLRRALEICRAEEIPALSGFEITIVEGAGAFVCGEETALIAAIEGRRANPRARPPYPSAKGLFGRPTLVNNVETLASVPWIVANGARRFRELGTGGSPGTKTFALAGRIERGGLIEVPMGMSVREVVERIGGGVQDGGRLKAIQIGGPSGSFIPSALADCAVDFDALRSAGGMMGSGGFIVLDERDCMVDLCRYFMEFTQAESCGKCTCCRIGTKRMLEILERLCAGEGRAGDIELLRELGSTVAAGSLCSLGKTAPNPVISALTHFPEEFAAHAAGRCPAGRCRALITYRIADTCIGCTRCAQSCPVGAIEPEPYRKHTIDSSLCIRCGTCVQVCPADAVRVE